MRHHVGHQKNHNAQRHQADDGRVERRAQQLGVEGLLVFQVIGQVLEHGAQAAALLARAHHRHKNARELARVARQRLGKCAAAVDLSTQIGHQIAFGLALGFGAERRQRPLQRKTRCDQTGQLARPHAQGAGVEHAAAKQAGAAAGLALRARGHGFDLERHQRLRAQLGARGFGRIGLDRAPAQEAVGCQGFKRVGGHELRALGA